MDINVKIKRYNPEKDARPYWAEYKLEVEGTDRVLDIINQIKWETDGTLKLPPQLCSRHLRLGRDDD